MVASVGVLGWCISHDVAYPFAGEHLHGPVHDALGHATIASVLALVLTWLLLVLLGSQSPRRIDRPIALRTAHWGVLGASSFVGAELVLHGLVEGVMPPLRALAYGTLAQAVLAIAGMLACTVLEILAARLARSLRGGDDMPLEVTAAGPSPHRRRLRTPGPVRIPYHPDRTRGSPAARANKVRTNSLQEAILQCIQ